MSPVLKLNISSRTSCRKVQSLFVIISPKLPFTCEGNIKVFELRAEEVYSMFHKGFESHFVLLRLSPHFDISFFVKLDMNDVGLAAHRAIFEIVLVLQDFETKVDFLVAATLQDAADKVTEAMAKKAVSA